jgi:hypothetical protein
MLLLGAVLLTTTITRQVTDNAGARHLQLGETHLAANYCPLPVVGEPVRALGSGTPPAAATWTASPLRPTTSPQLSPYW